MKKQILILVLAIFAIGFSTTAFGQDLVPRALECIDLTDPLNVVPGQPYTYEVNVPTPPGDKTFHWFVTQDVNMLTAGAISATVQTIGGPILAAGDVHYNVATADANTISLTFQSFNLAVDEYVFLGILVENTDDTGVGCTTNNFKVYRILPVHAFSLDMANVDGAGVVQTLYGQDDFTTCMADILTASYDPDNDAMAYDFDENAMYYVVAAANFSGDYRLSVLVASLTSSQTVTIDWDYTFGPWGNNMAVAGSANGTYTADVSPQAASGAVGAAGETIYIRLLIDHGTQYEGNAAANIQHTLAVNGNLLDGTGTPIPGRADIHHVGTTCAQVDFDDIALQSLIPRPAINSVSPPAPSGIYPDGYLPTAP